MPSLKRVYSVHGWKQTKNTTFIDRWRCENFSSMLTAFVLSAHGRKHLVQWNSMGQTVGRMWAAWVKEWGKKFVCCVRTLVHPTRSPAANQKDWTATAPPLPLSRAAYRTELERWTDQRFATTFETSDGPPSETERRQIHWTQQEKHCCQQSRNQQYIFMQITVILDYRGRYVLKPYIYLLYHFI